MSTNVCKIRKGQSHFKQKFNEFNYNDNLQYGTCQCPLTRTLVDLGKRTVSQAENRFCCKIDPYDGILKKKCTSKIDWERNIAKNHFYTYLHKLGKANQLSYDRFMVNVVEAM